MRRSAAATHHAASVRPPRGHPWPGAGPGPDAEWGQGLFEIGLALEVDRTLLAFETLGRFLRGFGRGHAEFVGAVFAHWDR